MRAWILLLLLACAGCAEPAEPVSATGTSASADDLPAGPEVRFGGLADVRAAIAAESGHPVLVNFWATWCPPCVAELPALREIAAEMEPKGLRVLGVSLDLLGPGAARGTVVEKVRSFLAARELELPTLILEPAEYEAVSKAYQLPGAVPITLALDRTGKVVDHHLGEAEVERFREMARKAIGP